MQVAVFYNRELVAYHARSSKRYGHAIVHDHMSSSHQFVSEWNPDKFTGWAKTISPAVEEYIARVLEATSYPEQAYRSCVGILSYEKKVGHQRLIQAVERATFFGAYNYTIIKKILQSGLDQLAFGEEVPTVQTLPDHGNIRGAAAYK